MKKIKFTPKEIGKINNVFYKNNISLSFERVEDYYRCFDEMSKLMFSIRKKHLMEEIFFKTIYEYDVNSSHFPTTKNIAYSYDSVLLHDDERIHEQMIIIRDFFHYNTNHYTIFDADYFFEISYNSDMSVKRGYCYFLMPGIVKQLSDDIFAKIMKAFTLEDASDYLIEFKNNTKIFDIYYFSFDHCDALRNIGFHVEKSEMVVNKIKEEYSDYEKITEVVDILGSIHRENTIGMQYSVDNKSFGIEIKIDPEKIYDYINILAEKNIVKSKNTFFKIIEKSNKKDSYVIKFKWSSNKKIKPKLYTVRYHDSLFNTENVVRKVVEKIKEHGA